MKFAMIPSLEHMTQVKIVVTLWNQNDVRALISKLSCDDLSKSIKWKTTEDTVIEKLTKLSLPEFFKKKLCGVIKPIGIEILEWMKYYHKHNTGMDLHHTSLPAPELCWNSQGTVDRKRTAEVLIRDENLDIFTRYKLACDYCLEDDIIRFWNKLPENLKNYNWDDFPVISFWSDNMKREGGHHIFYKDIFYSSVLTGNKVAAKYFLQKLTSQEREECLEELAEDAYNVDVLCFLLPEMEEEEQMSVFESDPCGVLQYFLRWPFQGFFIGIANCVWDFLSSDMYDGILGNIIGKVKEGYKDYDYQKLFRECWQKIPIVLKDSLIQEIDDSLLTLLFHIKDKKTIRLILKDATPTAKVKIIYNDEINFYLAHAIRENNWDFLEFCIREFFSSESEMLKFKEAFEKRVYFKWFSAKEKDKWNQIFRFSDDFIFKDGKRSLKEGESSSSKRFQSLQ